MKTRMAFALFVVFALLLSLSTFADVAYTPRDDFYEEHYRGCVGLELYHFTNGAEGYVVAYSSPTGDPEVVIPNGREYFVSVIWTSDEDGKTWGCIEYDPDTLEISYAFQGGESAWVDMSSMYRRYDSVMFMTEHESELQHSHYNIYVEEGRELLAYRYPGSGIIEYRFPYIEDIENTMSTEYLYTDTEGREWGYVGYHYGRVNAWICISEPYTELPAGAEYREPELIPAASESEMEAALDEVSGVSAQLIVGTVGVIAIAAAIVIYTVLKKRKSN